MQLDRLSSFPVTAFDADGALGLDPYREHLRHQIDAGPAAIFACCGTGEFFSLTLDEYAAAVRVEYRRPRGRCPCSPAPATAPRWPGSTRRPREAGADG